SGARRRRRTASARTSLTSRTGSPPWIPHRRFAERARRLLDTRLQLVFRLRDRSDVLIRLGALGVLGAAIELPGRDDNFFLRGDEIVDVAGRALAGHRRALRERELLLVRLHVEEEDVAARLVRPRPAREIARPHVVGNEVTRLDVEIFEIQRVAPGRRRAL